jgi:hypothetical protein
MAWVIFLEMLGHNLLEEPEVAIVVIGIINNHNLRHRPVQNI